MTDPEEIDEDLFADLYEGDETEAKPTATVAAAKPFSPPAPDVYTIPEVTTNGGHQEKANATSVEQTSSVEKEVQAPTAALQAEPDHRWDPRMTNGHTDTAPEYEPVGIKEDGKMFIGGLNWETTDQSLRDYFSQFGEVLDCNVMRDGASGRSRGFGFLTFKDPKTVNSVMVKEHYLDGKIIDPKRAIPREEQERTSKIFVGGVSQEATERDFKEFFMQFGRVVDATLMMDKDTGRPRGFGFVTFDGDAAVDATLSGPLAILGKPIEVKRAQPRGNLEQDDGGRPGKFNRHNNHRHDRFQRDNDRQGGGGYEDHANHAQQAPQPMNNNNNNLSPQMMAQYWQRMQQYFAMMQQQMAAGVQQGQAMGNQMGMAQMTPHMNQQMMQQMMAMQQSMGRVPGMSPGGSPHPQSPAPQGMPGMPLGMTPAMMQQMQQMQQIQQMQQMQMQQQSGYPGVPPPMTPTPPVIAPARPGFNAQEQLAFEQRKYEQQQAHRMQQQPPQPYVGAQYPGQGGPTSWEGMYEDVPQPNMGGQGGAGRGAGGAGRGGMQHNRGSQGPTLQSQNGVPSQAPANAPTGPKNAGKPGANYRGGGRGGRQGFHPYSRG